MDGQQILGAVLQYGVLGVVLLLIMIGWLVPKPSADQIRADRDEWRRAYEAERAAHAATRTAMTEAGRRAEVAVETARTTNFLLDHLGHSAVPPAPSGVDGGL